MIERLLKAARKYNLWDYVWFKVTLFSFGLLCGVYLYPLVTHIISVFWLLFIVGFIWIGYKTFFKYLY